jgi:glycosyl transferase family 25
MPETNSIPLFLINLDSRPDRLEKMISRLGDLPFERIAAVDGQNLDEREFISQSAKFRMAKNEIACILSHKVVWQKIIAENIPYACILEDDVHLSSSFPHFIRNPDWLPDNFTVIKIETFLARVFLSLRKFPAGDRLLRQLGSMHAGTAGYIVSLEGAVNLLDSTQHPGSPLDHLMFEVTSINSGFKVLQMCPALCIQEDVLYPDISAASDITDARSRVRPKEKIDFIPKLWRETKRPYLQLLSLLRLVRENLIIVRYVPFS